MQGKKEYTEKLFLNFQLSDKVPEDNFYRNLQTALNLDWLYKATSKYYGKEGQESIDPVVFFKLNLIGYLENLSSDRRIINTATMRLDLLFFIGYDIDEALPWHSTLSRTRQLYGDEVFKKLFKQILQQCIEKGMVAGKRQAVDSAPVKANASMESLIEKEILSDGDDYTDELNADDTLTKNTVSAARKKVVDNQHRGQAKAYKDMPSSNSEERKFVSNHTHRSTTDPDARISVKPGKPRQLNYHAQVAVDTAHHVITQIQSDYANKKDSQCLPSLLKNTIENLEENNLTIEELLGDGGYSSGEALQALEDNNIEGYIPNFGQYKHDREGFTYDKKSDKYTCSQGKELPFKKISKSSLGYERKSYRSSALDCARCPLRSQCIGKSDFKKIEDTVNKPLYDRMHVKLQTKKAKRMKKLRSSTVEPVLGTLVNYLGMRRINTRGIEQANKCMLMAAIACNLKKLLKFTTRKVQTSVQVMQVNLQALFLNKISLTKPTSFLSATLYLKQNCYNN
ncbi:MAG: IS1182 family transposase [Chitinophagaceae bacterium]